MTLPPLKPDDARAAGVQTFVDVLEYRARHEPGTVIFRELHGDGIESGSLTFLELQRRSRAIAVALADATLPGDRVALLVPPGIDYIAAFFGCLYAGVVAVPAYPPSPRRPDGRVGRMVADCGARVALVDDGFVERLDRFLEVSPELASLTWLGVGRLVNGDASLWRAPDVTGESLAMLQYTSGSTAEPRGVMLGHAELLHNAAIIHSGCAHREGDQAVFWLPPFHDMGLLGGVVQPVYASVPTAVMAPATFLQRPARWLEAITHYRATTSGAPNFAYALCVERVSNEERAALDLSSWRTAFNGAEVVRADTLRTFHDAFAPAGLRRDVFVPCYGLAESTLLVAGARVDAVTATDPVEVGAPMPGMSVCIVDPDARAAVVDGEIGEIWVHGGSVARGYWNRPDTSRSTFAAQCAHDDRQWMRTGDLGMLRAGRLVVTGRVKDLVILDGRNHYPQDIEQIAERSHGNLRAGFSCAFSIAGARGEELVYVAEVTRHHQPADDAPTMRAVRSELAAHLGIVPSAVVLVRAHSIPRTSSGKLRRGACRTAYLTGALEVVGEWRARRGDLATPESALVAFIVDWLANELGVPPATLTRETRLRDRGMDSLAAARLLVALEEQTGRSLEAATLWAQPTVGALAAAALGTSNASELGAEQTAAESTDIAQWPEVTQLRARRDALTTLGLDDPFFVEHDGVAGREIQRDGRTLLHFAGYNYLGLAGDAEIRRAAHDAIDRWGTSVSASRLVSGERAAHAQLESAIARFTGTEAAVAFLGGHLANTSTIPCLVGPGDAVFCDEHLHNSGMLGAQYSGARRLVFPHNDLAALEVMLRRHRPNHRRALILVEGLYSADGDVPDLKALVALKTRHHALLMVDEAHSIGVLGATGRGIAEHAGVDPADVDVWMGTLSKAFASAGGYIAGSRVLVEHLKFAAPGFVFSVGMPPADAAAAAAAIARLERDPSLVERLRANGAEFVRLARGAGLDIGESRESPIIPVIIGSSESAMRVAASCVAEGINVAPMIAPAVPEGRARLRFFVSAAHTTDDLTRAVQVTTRAIAAAMSTTESSA